MLRGGGEPLVVEITEEAALAFPCGKGTDPSAGHRLRPWLAVGLDVTGRGTYSLRWLAAVGLDRAEERDWAEVTMLAQLAAQMQIPGFPSRAHAGRDG